MFAVHVRSFLARHPRLHRSIVIGLALTAGGLVASLTASAGQARTSWGDRRVVWVAVGDTDAGSPLVVRPIEAPLALVPAGALLDTPTGVARRDVGAGEIVTDADVLGADALDDLLAHRRGVAVPADDTTLPVVVGDRVDVAAVGRVLATNAVVIDVSAGVVVVAVDEGAAAEVAAAAVDRTAVLVLAVPAR